jgi:hypothetical protein
MFQYFQFLDFFHFLLTLRQSQPPLAMTGVRSCLMSNKWMMISRTNDNNSKYADIRQVSVIPLFGSDSVKVQTPNGALIYCTIKGVSVVHSAHCTCT